MLGEVTTDTTAIDQLVGILTNVRVPGAMQRMEEEFAGDMAGNILQSQGPDGRSYPPLAQPRPPGHNQGERPLIDTGELLRTLIDGPGHIAEITDDSLRMGTDNWKAAIHQEGTDTIPARPMVGVNEDMADEAAGFVADDLFKQLGV